MLNKPDASDNVYATLGRDTSIENRPPTAQRETLLNGKLCGRILALVTLDFYAEKNIKVHRL